MVNALWPKAFMIARRRFLSTPLTIATRVREWESQREPIP
jgi:hypothetical protein